MSTVPEVYLEHVHAAAAAELDTLRRIWSPDGVLELPYAGGLGTPEVLRGLPAIESYFTDLDLFGPFEIETIEGWSTVPDEWILEMHARSTVLATGAPYEQDYVVRFRLDDAGRLVWMREYWDPTRLG